MIQPHMFHMGAEGLFQSQWKLILDHGDSIITVLATLSSTLSSFGEGSISNRRGIGDDLELLCSGAPRLTIQDPEDMIS